MDEVKRTGAKNSAGAAADAKVTSIVAGMVAGADSMNDLDLLRHGAMPTLFGGIRALSTLGTFLRAFTHGHALQLHAMHRRFRAALAAHTSLLPRAGQVALIDVDSPHNRVYGRAKQDAPYGRFKGGRTLHPLLATICTATSRSASAAARIRRRAVLASNDSVWQQITYPTAVPDPDTGELISDAEVAEMPDYTAFASHTKSEQVTDHLTTRPPGPDRSRNVEELDRPAGNTCPATATAHTRLTSRSKDHSQAASVDRG
ncbi:MAG: hypothetical protein HOY75_33215 [Streptomyces sp.]|nr:hypothetical protein [Streptomyces sp.]